MPDAFSPSRSLKYCFMTLRTVSESSFSRASDLLSDRFLGCNGDLFCVVFEPSRPAELVVEEFRDGRELLGSGLELVHAGAEHCGVPETLRVPSDVLARYASAAFHPVES